LPADTLAVLSALDHSSDASFNHLVEISGLSREYSFRHADLRNFDFTNADLRRFNFTGADLRGATGINVRFDDSTVFVEARGDASIFNAEIGIRKVLADRQLAREVDICLRQSSLDQAIWAGRLLKKAINAQSVAMCSAILFRTKDAFARSEILMYLSTSLPTDSVRDLVLASLSKDSDSAASVSKSLATARLRGLAKDAAIRNAVMALVRSSNILVQRDAIQFLYNHHLRQEEWAALAILAQRDPRIHQLHAQTVAKRLGEEYDLIVRYPDSNAIISAGDIVDRPLIKLIARRWLRAEAAVEDRPPLVERKLPAIDFNPAEIDSRAEVVLEKFAVLRKHGVIFTMMDTVPNILIRTKDEEDPKRQIILE